MQKSSLLTPVGWLTLAEVDGYICHLTWEEQPQSGGRVMAPSGVLKEASDQITAYFAGGLQKFDLPLRVLGSDFQRAVCAEIAAIPFGQTCEYGDIACRLGSAAQPVGTACGLNPLPILIPCHRVLAATGLGGFSGQGGIETKVALLRHEGAAGLLI